MQKFGWIAFADGMVRCRVDRGKGQDTWNLTFSQPPNNFSLKPSKAKKEKDSPRTCPIA